MNLWIVGLHVCFHFIHRDRDGVGVLLEAAGK